MNEINNNISFGAKLCIKDNAKCFSLPQKIKLKHLAKKIGTDEDRVYIGTRKYKGYGVCSNKLITRIDLALKSILGNKVHDMLFNNNTIVNLAEKEVPDFENMTAKMQNKFFKKTLYKHLKGVLENYKPQHTFEIGNSSHVEAKDALLKETKQFGQLKNTFHKETILEKLRKTFTPKSKAYEKQYPPEYKSGNNIPDSYVNDNSETSELFDFWEMLGSESPFEYITTHRILF